MEDRVGIFIDGSNLYHALRANFGRYDLNFSVFWVLILFVAFNLVYTLAATPAGVISDKLGRKRVIVVGWTIYALSYLGLGLASAKWEVWLLFALYGLYYGISEGVTRAFVSDLVPVEKRGTAYGWYHAAVGVSLLPASVIAGLLWQYISPAVTFYFGAGMAGVAMLGLLLFIREK